LATTDLFPPGARDAAFEWLSALLASLRDALTTLRAFDASPNTTGALESEHNKPQISLVDLAKKATESDAKAHKWEIKELRNTTRIAGLQGELSKFCFFFQSVGMLMAILCAEKVKARSEVHVNGFKKKKNLYSDEHFLSLFFRSILIEQTSGKTKHCSKIIILCHHSMYG
jgi:hypothetical protein